MLESTCCLPYDTTDDSKNDPCNDNNWTTCPKPFKCSDLPQGKTISELCCSGRADLAGGVYKCRNSISFKNALVVVGSSVASGYHLIGQGCQGCTDPNDPTDTPIKCDNTDFISPEKCESNQSSCSKDCCACYTSYIAWYNTNFSNSVSDTYNYCHPGACTASTLIRLQNKNIKTMSPKFVFIGLSTGNERNKYEDGCTAKPVSEIGPAFVTGMENIITYLNPDINKLDIKLIIGGMYTNSESAQFTQAVQAFKDLHTKYNYPMVDFMGVLVDVNSNTPGSWAPGFQQVENGGKISWANFVGENNYATGDHPNGLGSEEMFFAIVPSIFDAYDKIENYQDLDIKWQNKCNQGQPGPIEFIVPDNQQMHSWSIQFTVIKKNQDDVFKITGTSYTTDVPVPGRYPSKVTEDNITDTDIQIQQGDTILITHSYSCATIIIYIERSGKMMTTQKYNKRFIPSKFLLIGSDNIFSNLCIWRTCLIPQYFDQQTLQHQSYFSRASLELYAPLDTNYSNVALSLSRLSNDIIINMDLIDYTNNNNNNNNNNNKNVIMWTLLLLITVLLIIALIFIWYRKN